MKQLTFKTRKALLAYATAVGAIDLTTDTNYLQGLNVVSVTHGVYGMNSALLVDGNGQYYVIGARCTNLFYYV